MAVANPVLYSMGLVTPGRSTGVFRRVSTATPLSDVAQQRNTATEKYNADVASASEGIEGRKAEYDDLVKSLTEGLDPIKTSLESLTGSLTDLRSKIQSSSTAANTARATYYALPTKHKTSTVGDFYRRQYYSALGETSTYTSQYNTKLGEYNKTKSSYDIAATDAKSQQEAAYQEYAGGINEAKSTLDTEMRSIEGLGYLAQGAATVSPNATAPSPADLYSADLDTVLAGRKEAALTAAPEEDIVTGTIQSSLWK